MIYKLDEKKPEFPDNDDYWVAPDANVIGKVRLMSGASVWFGATLRGDNEWIEIGVRLKCAGKFRFAYGYWVSSDHRRQLHHRA